MDLTIIIPTKNRFIFLKKILNYYNDVNYAGSLLILDSSNKKIYQQQEELIKKFTSIKIKHFYSKYTPMHAIKEHLDKIKTRFATYSGDDDYHLVQGLNKCIDYLSNNSNISSVRGSAYLFELNQNLSKVKDIHQYNSYNYIEEKAIVL